MVVSGKLWLSTDCFRIGVEVMIRKLARRAVKVGAVVFAIGVTTLVVMACLAVSEPRFYSELSESSGSTATDSAWAEKEMADFERWIHKSRAIQRSQARQAARGEMVPQPYDPGTDAYEIRFTEEQLNQQLASRRHGSMNEPRIRLLDDRMLIGAEFDLKRRLVFSVEVCPTVTADGRLQLDIQSSRLGRLPFPLRTVLGWLTRFPDFRSGELQLDLTGPTPVFVVDLSRGPKYPAIRSVRCTEGELAIEFKAPVVQQTVAQRR